MSRTLALLKDDILVRADMTGTDELRVTSTQFTAIINSSLAELYDLLLDTYEDHYTVSDVSTVASGNTLTLPSTFYKLRKVEYLQSDGRYWPVRPTALQEAHRFNISSVFTNEAQGRAYVLLNSSLFLLPETAATGTYRVWFFPKYVPLVAAADVANDLQGWTEYAIVDATIKLLAIEESDVSLLMAQKEALRRRIESSAVNRDGGGAQRILEVEEVY